MSILIKNRALKLSNQECFDLAWNWNESRHPKCLSLSNSGACHYRNDDNTNACLIGILIPDAFFEKNPIACKIDSPSVWPKTKCLFDKNIDLNFLIDLQNAHDSTARSDNHNIQVRDSLILIAQKYKLNCPESKIIGNAWTKSPIVVEKTANNSFVGNKPKNKPFKNKKPKKVSNKGKSKFKSSNSKNKKTK